MIIVEQYGTSNNHKLAMATQSQYLNILIYIRLLKVSIFKLFLKNTVWRQYFIRSISIY